MNSYSENQNPYDEDPALTKKIQDCMQEVERFKHILHEAQQQYDYERRESLFVRRSGGSSPAKEKAIFARLNKRPKLTINRKPE